MSEESVCSDSGSFDFCSDLEWEIWKDSDEDNTELVSANSASKDTAESKSLLYGARIQLKVRVCFMVSHFS